MISLRYKIKLLFCDESEKEFCVFAYTQLGFVPGDVFHYKRALTHKSALKRKLDDNWNCNERLEFLGDSILDSVVSDFLYKHYAHKDEGFLTKMRSKIVNRKSLNELAQYLKLDKYLVSNNLHLKNNNALGNAFEALVGAIYLDKGYRFTHEFITEKILRKYIDFNFLENVDTNFKSQLIEVIQRNKYEIHFETTENEEAETTKKQFISVVSINNNEICKAKGYTKKEAEQNASKKALKTFDA